MSGRAPDARTVGLAFCELAGWRANFQPTKGRLFLAHALHLARHGEALVADPFFASDYGVETAAWKKYCAMYGARPIPRPPRLPFLKPLPHGLALLSEKD